MYASLSADDMTYNMNQKHFPAFSTDDFFTHDANDLHMIVGGDRHNSYCRRAGFEASRYQLKRADHAEFYQYSCSIDGTMRPVYCLEKGGTGPEVGALYTSVPINQLSHSTFSDAVRREVAFILGNFYPAVSATESLNRLGVNTPATPSLDENDVYAMIQTALWGVMGQVSTDEMVFVQCANKAQPHPKSDTLRALVLRLMSMARDYYAAGDAGNGSRQLSFSGSPGELRAHGGQPMVGPFMLRSSLSDKPKITVEPLGLGNEMFSWTFSDDRGNPMAAPGMNQPFYLLLDYKGGPVCLRVKASSMCQANEVITFVSNSGTQDLGTVRPVAHTVSASTHVCIDCSSEKSPYSGYPSVSSLPPMPVAPSEKPSYPGYPPVSSLPPTPAAPSENSPYSGYPSVSSLPPMPVAPSEKSPYPGYPSVPSLPPTPVAPNGQNQQNEPEAFFHGRAQGNTTSADNEAVPAANLSFGRPEPINVGPSPETCDCDENDKNGFVPYPLEEADSRRPLVEMTPVKKRDDRDYGNRGESPEKYLAKNPLRNNDLRPGAAENRMKSRNENSPPYAIPAENPKKKEMPRGNSFPTPAPRNCPRIHQK